MKKIALVTGGSGALGSAIAQRLAADGLHIVVHSNKNLASASETVEKIAQAGGSAQAEQFDITDPQACTTALERLLEQGPIQVLVNNAGIHDDAVMPGMSLSQWNSVIDVSLNGFFHVTQPLLMPMIRTRWGRIINVSSVSAVTGNRGQANYAAAKAGLHGASKSLSLEVASRGITVNVITPGIIESAMAEQAFDADRISQMVPMKRAGKPEEVAALVGFLASDQASYISGQIIGVNGALA
ncbi:MAG: 3-oxoacyl-ACP reductase FabG [Burkholderiaceae bacterium]